MPRIARIVALALPVLLVCVLATTGGWRIHDGRVERVGQAATSTRARLAAPAASPGATDEVTFVRHLSFSVPWQAVGSTSYRLVAGRHRTTPDATA
jgi:hypothetical protein